MPSLAALARDAHRIGSDTVLLYDGADALPLPHWQLLRLATRRAGGLVITAHAPGRLPTLVQTSTDAALLGELAAELVGPAARELGPLLEQLRAERAGNLREVFLTLYDLAARDDPHVVGCLAEARSR